MMRRSTKIQLVAFLVITVLGMAYVGATDIGVNPLRPPYTVYLNLPSSGGLFTNADVAERGVVVGRVAAVDINPSRTGVRVALHINHGVKISSTGLTARVNDLSAVGEQYVELEPTTTAAPYLAHGSTIPAVGKVPTEDSTILLNLKNLLDTIDVNDLSTVVKQLGKGFNDLGPSLQRLIDNSDALTRAATRSLPTTLRLINNGKTVLDTQNQVSSELKSFASSFADLTGEVSARDQALRGVLDNGVRASTQLQQLLSANAPVLPVLLNNLNTFTKIETVRVPYTRAVLELYPAIASDAFYALPKPGKNGISTARFGLVTDFNDWCEAGYGSTKHRPNRASAWGGAANLDAYCHGNNAALDKQGVDLRGSRYAPRPSGDHANITNSDPYPGPHYGQPFPGSGKVGACGTPSCPSTAKARSATARGGSSRDVVVRVPYDPNTGLVEGPNGKLYQLGLNGPVAPVFGSSSYSWLLLAPTMR